MHIAFVAGMKDSMLSRMLKPIISLPFVEKISLIRYAPLSLEKVTSYAPPSWIAVSRILRDIYRVVKIFFLCLFDKVDILVGIHFSMHCVYVGIMGLLFRIPTVFMIVEDPKKYKGKFLFHFFIQRADFIFVRGTQSQSYLINELGVDKTRVDVLVDYLEFPEKTSRKDENFKYDFMFVGRFVPVKRLDFLLKVFNRLKKEHIRFRAILVGEGPLFENIQKQISEGGLDDCVETPGYVDDLNAVFDQSKVFIMSSETEGLPIALIEALQKGLPCIVPRVGDIVDLAKHQENALVVEPLDEEAFAQAATQMIANKGFYDKLAAQSAQIFDPTKYSLKGAQSAWKQVLTQLRPDRI